MADWKNIGQARWYDCKLGTMRDEDLAQLVGTKKNVIRYRRQLFGIEAWNVRMAIEPPSTTLYRRFTPAGSSWDSCQAF